MAWKLAELYNYKHDSRGISFNATDTELLPLPPFKVIQQLGATQNKLPPTYTKAILSFQKEFNTNFTLSVPPRSFLLSFPSFHLSDVLCDPSDLIWR